MHLHSWFSVSLSNLILKSDLSQIDNLKLNYDNVTRTTSNQPGVDIRIPGWGDSFVVEYIDPSKASPGSYYKDVGNMLVNELGYTRNLSLRGAPYDFRKGPSMYQRKKTNKCLK